MEKDTTVKSLKAPVLVARGPKECLFHSIHFHLTYQGILYYGLEGVKNRDLAIHY